MDFEEYEDEDEDGMVKVRENSGDYYDYKWGKDGEYEIEHAK